MQNRSREGNRLHQSVSPAPGERRAPQGALIGSIMAGTGNHGGGNDVLWHGSESGVTTHPIDPSFSLWLAVSVLGVIASGRQLLDADRSGNRLSAWISALAFLAFSVSAALDLAELLGRAA